MWILLLILDQWLRNSVQMAHWGEKMIHKRDHTRHVFAKGPDYPIKVGHLLSYLCWICCWDWVGISDVGFYVTNSILQCRNFRDRIWVPTVDVQPGDPPDVILPKKVFKMPNVAVELLRCGILCEIDVWYLRNCMLLVQVCISLVKNEILELLDVDFHKNHWLFTDSLSILKSIFGKTDLLAHQNKTGHSHPQKDLY